MALQTTSTGAVIRPGTEDQYVDRGNGLMYDASQGGNPLEALMNLFGDQQAPTGPPQLAYPPEQSIGVGGPAATTATNPGIQASTPTSPLPAPNVPITLPTEPQERSDQGVALPPENAAAPFQGGLGIEELLQPTSPLQQASPRNSTPRPVDGGGGLLEMLLQLLGDNSDTALAMPNPRNPTPRM